jgi:hypothetical protein
MAADALWRGRSQFAITRQPGGRLAYSEMLAGWRPDLRPLDENKAVLDGKQIQYPVQFKSYRLNFGAELVDSHPFHPLVRGRKGMPFRKFDYYQPSIWL